MKDTINDTSITTKDYVKKRIDFAAAPELSVRDHRRMVTHVCSIVFGSDPYNFPQRLHPRTYTLLHYVTALRVRNRDFNGPDMFDYASVGDVVLEDGLTVREDCERLLDGRFCFGVLLHELIDEVAWDIEEDDARRARTGGAPA